MVLAARAFLKYELKAEPSKQSIHQGKERNAVGVVLGSHFKVLPRKKTQIQVIFIFFKLATEGLC